MTKIGLIQFLLLFLVSAAWGQKKVKYKDIYALLSTKQYEQAEPFLKAYMRDNPDTPNGWLFMGQIFQEKASRNDVLKQTGIAVANMDSAITFFTKATQLIDDRELRRNEDYYESYNRRDLRTGKFGVKLSDIQFDISKKVEGLKERISAVKMTSAYFSLADSAYRKANARFASLQEKFPAENQLYLRADEATIESLTRLGQQYDSCVKAFSAYKSALSLLGKTGYNQDLTVAPIEDFKTQGASPADFYQDNVKLWNYRQFADETLTVIREEILPLREHLVDYDTQLNKLSEKLAAESVSVRSDLTRLIDKLLFDQLKKYDAEPLPMLVFAIKTADLEYRSLVLEHQPLRDSMNLHLQVDMVRQELHVLDKLDSVATVATADKISAKAADYADFIAKAYGDVPSLTSHLRMLQAFGQSQAEQKRVQLDGYLSALNYIVDGADSIPLLRDSLSVWKMVMTEPEKYTLGVNTNDEENLQGYFYTIVPSRTVDVKAQFPLDTKAFTMSAVQAAQAAVRTDGNGQIYYVLLYSTNAVNEKFPAALAKIYRSDGLAWKKDLSLAFVPVDMMLNPETSELVILNDTNELVVDKNGETVK